MLLAPGTRLGPYTIESLIGSGGMGEVYKAHDGRLNRTVAIKRLIADDVSRFQSEARAIAAINHPHIWSSSISRGNPSAVPSVETKRCSWRAKLPTPCTRRTNAAFFTAI
jgi:serine/threonine protein kinase